MAIELAFLLVLPFMSFIGGIFFFYKAYDYMSQLGRVKNTLGGLMVVGGFSVLSGNPKAENQLASFVEQAPCIYSRLLFEYFEPKRKQWVSINTFVKKSKFTLTWKDKEFVVDPTGAEFDVYKRIVFQEDKKTTFSRTMAGEVRQMWASSRFMRPVELMSHRAEPYGTAFDSEPFDANVFAALETEPEVRKLLYRYEQYRKRATIETIKELDNVVVIGNAFPRDDIYVVNKGAGMFLISSDTIDNILKHMNGKSMISILIGTGLVLLSFLLTYVILF
jgi:hypothetical protein